MLALTMGMLRLNRREKGVAALTSPRERIDELNEDAEPTPDELELLAELWWVTPEGLRRSIEEAKANP